mmetsp:Transcript_4097/g.16427  ORF Transcript_4097/g.16427 Transcript_4097/m.16427 type:complete len:265 (-) Transcript_4097:647-1441(-)
MPAAADTACDRGVSVAPWLASGAPAALGVDALSASNSQLSRSASSRDDPPPAPLPASSLPAVSGDEPCTAWPVPKSALAPTAPSSRVACAGRSATLRRRTLPSAAYSTEDDLVASLKRVGSSFAASAPEAAAPSASAPRTVTAAISWTRPTGANTPLAARTASRAYASAAATEPPKSRTNAASRSIPMRATRQDPPSLGVAAGCCSPVLRGDSVPLDSSLVVEEPSPPSFAGAGDGACAAFASPSVSIDGGDGGGDALSLWPCP